MRVGANVQEGQDVVVTCLVEHAPIARAVTREAYRAGAQHVIFNLRSVHDPSILELVGRDVIPQLREL